MNRARQHGFSLVETLVGMAIGLLTVLVIAQTISVAEGYKRNASSGNDAQTSGAIALYLLERDARMAGYGLVSTENDGVLAVCTNGIVQAYNSARSPSDFSYPANTFAPLVINPGNIPAGDANSDVLLINYSGSFGMVGSGATFSQLAGANADYKLDNRSGFHQGDIILAVQPGQNCTIAEITGLPSSNQCGNSTGQSDVVNHLTGSYNNFNKNCVATTPTWNKAGGLGVTYTSGKIYNLGQADQIVSRAYAVRSGKLTMCNMLASDCTAAAQTGNANVWVPVADDVVALKAEYGKDDGSTGTANDHVLDGWDTTTPGTFTAWSQLMAVRIGIVARSRQFSKDAVTSDKTSGTGGLAALPTWNGGNFTLTHLTDWQHYRYKVFQTVIPLRNMIWGST